MLMPSLKHDLLSPILMLLLNSYCVKSHITIELVSGYRGTKGQSDLLLYINNESSLTRP
jgi:hypothetical protein